MIAARIGSVPTFSLSVVAPILLIAAALFAAGEPQDAVLLTGGGAGLFLAALALERGWHHRRTVRLTAYALPIAVLCVTLRVRDPLDKSIDAQVAGRLMAVAAMGLIALPAVTSLWQRRGASLMPWAALFAILALSAQWAPSPGYAAVAAATNASAFLYLCRIADTEGADGVAEVLTRVTSGLAAASVAVYVAVPSLGRLQDWVNGAYVETSRLQGVLGHANAAGASGGLGLLLLVFLVRRWPLPLRVACAAPCFVCLVLSHNRMAMAATAAAMTCGWIAGGPLARRATLAMAAAGAGLFVVALAGDDIAAALSRSGRAAEISTLTGRTDVWQTVLSLWERRPLLGYGFTASQTILPQQPNLFEAAAHTHNFYLEMLFAGGLLAAGALVVAIGSSLSVLTREAVAGPGALLIYFLLYGFSEPIIASTAGLPTFGFLGAIVMLDRWRQRERLA